MNEFGSYQQSLETEETNWLTQCQHEGIHQETMREKKWKLPQSIRFKSKVGHIIDAFVMEEEKARTFPSDISKDASRGRKSAIKTREQKRAKGFVKWTRRRFSLKRGEFR